MIFKIALIILIAAPVIALAAALYAQVIKYIRAKNRSEKETRRR